MVLSGDDGATYVAKVLSTPPEFHLGVVQGLERILGAAGIPASAITGVVHGTTVATNAILEGRGAPTALITTRGFRDVLEIARMRYPSLYDVSWEKPKPLVPRRHRLEIDLRINSRGELERPYPDGELDRLVEELRADGIRSVAVCFINSYLNPELEHRFAEELRYRCPKMYVTASVAISPEIKEYERTSTAVVNAYIQPLVALYVDKLERELSQRGVNASLLIMQSSGGALSARDASAKPVNIIESGPAAGVTAAKGLARELDLSNVIAFDMGGTTAKASLIEGGQAFEAPEFEVGGGMNTRGGLARGGGYTVRVPAIDIAEVGAGGGSICWIDSGGAPRVGPHSAGAVPGPACYGAGGTLPTITDALVVLGYLSSESLAGGIQRVDRGRAVQVMKEQFADPLGLDLLEAAMGACQIAVVSMSKALKAVSSERGRDPRDFVLIAFGGAGPAFAADMARSLGMQRVVVPVNSGLFSAIGLLAAPIQHHDVRTYTQRDHLDAALINQAFAEMEERMLTIARADGSAPSQTMIERYADLHYLGQSSTLRIPAPNGELTEADLKSLRSRFDEEHERTYGHMGTEQSVELANLRVRLTLGLPHEDTLQSSPSSPVGDDRAAGRGQSVAATRDAYFGRALGMLRTPVLSRSQLLSTPSEGPLIVEDMDATIVVPPDARASCDASGHVVIEL